MRKHRLAERLLVDVIGLEWEYVHEEACRWEHVISERVERKLLEVLHNPTESPYGTPIPGLEELGEPAGRDLPDRRGPLRGGRRDGRRAVEVVVRRLGEPAQLDHDVLSLLSDSGVRPGRTVQVRRVAGGVVVGGDGAEGLDLPELTASHIFVSVPA